MVKRKSHHSPSEHISSSGERNNQDFLTLSDTDLLNSLLLAVNEPDDEPEVAQDLMSHFGGLRGILNASINELQQLSDLDQRQRHLLITSFEICRRLLRYQSDEKITVKNAQDAYQLIADMITLPREHIRLILLDNHRQVIATPTIYIGTINAAVIRSAEIYKEAIMRDAPALILVHNHPSGNASPSPEDVTLTRSLIQAGILLDIVFVDHIIIGNNGWTSLKEMGLGFDSR